MSGNPTKQPEVHYIAFDKVTGRILHRHSRFDVESGSYVEMPIEDIRAMIVNEPSIVAALTDRDIANLDIMSVDTNISSEAVVDVAKRILAAMPKLCLATEKTEIEGDGKDSTVIAIEVRDAYDKRVRNACGPVKVTTTRGRLSARGGLVDLVDGKATITLTSVAESVSAVQVSATSPGGLYVEGEITLEFV